MSSEPLAACDRDALMTDLPVEVDSPDPTPKFSDASMQASIRPSTRNVRTQVLPRTSVKGIQKL